MLSLQMMELIYKKKMAYFESGGDEDWKNILARTYPKEPPQVTPPWREDRERLNDEDWGEWRPTGRRGGGGKGGHKGK